MVLTFAFVDEILEILNEYYSAVFSSGTVCYNFMVVLTFASVDEILECGH